MTFLQDHYFKRKPWLYFFLILIPFLLYIKSLGFGFSPLDEQWLIEDNAWFISRWSNLKAVFTGSTALMIYYRPFFVVSTIIDFHIGQLEPLIYHLDTLLWHLGCTLLLFEWLRQYQLKNRVAFFLALIFAVHPVMLHAVAWIPGRNDSMLCFFMIASLINLNNYIERKKTRYFIFHILFFLCALLTKESAIVFPAIYFAIIYQREKENKRLLLSSLASSLILLFGWYLIWTSYVSVQEFTKSSFAAVFGNAITAYFLYIGKVIFPFQQSVSPVLKYSSVLPGCLTLSFAYFLWWRFRPEDSRTAFLGILMFLMFLMPPVIYIAMNNDGAYYEHRLYTPMIGVILFFSQLRIVLRPTLVKFAFAGTIILMFFTYKRMDVYRNKFSFLDDAIRSDPESYFLYLRRGQILDSQGDYERAIEAFNVALKISPHYGQAYFNRANAYFSLGNKPRAIDDYGKALICSKPSLKQKILMQRCIALDVFNEPELAMKDLETLKLCCGPLVDENFERALRNKLEIERWRGIIGEQPGNAELYLMRGMFFMEKHMTKEALADFKKATEIDPHNMQYRELFKRASIDLVPH